MPNVRQGYDTQQRARATAGRPSRSLTADRGATLPWIPNKHQSTPRAILGSVNGRSTLTLEALSAVR
jgi:hypothetical protein